ncbi:MAG TPA: glycosyltransferase family 39 protein, partial [Nitrososphaera sp.]|nr:glycosyltransferase family 39 protein [Nitrososphaera sp.]
MRVEVHASDSHEASAQSRGSSKIALCLLFAGCLVRLWLAYSIFLNPDEALHYLLSLQPSLALTYQETLGTAHPPLYIVFLHYWGYLGHSEFFLRLPSVATSVGYCWMIFLWLDKVTTRKSALIALGLMLFSPALIYLSVELRQYAFLLFFCSTVLYFLERAVEKNSVVSLVFSGCALGLALLTHYSALFFAFTLGLYALIRIWSFRPSTKFIATWIAIQLAALGIIAVLYKTHISHQVSNGQAEAIADSYLRGSIFHPAQDHVLSFIFKTTIRLFHYVFSQEVVGIAGLLLFVYAIVVLWHNSAQISISAKPTSRQLGFLLGFPLMANCALALRGIYPYGGTRHDSYLAIFAISGIAIALARWSPRKKWIPTVSLATVLLICNLFPAATGQYITRKNQRREVMQSAVNYLRDIPPGSIIFTDNQGGLLLSYYLCDRKVVLFDPPYEDL